jgi:uncharacterized protein (DUF433 family)
MATIDRATSRTAALEQRADDTLIDRWIEPNPHKLRTDEAWLRDSAVPVWAIVGYLEAVKGDVAQVAADYDVPREAVEGALAYYRRHKTLIDARIAANALP